MAPFHMCPSHEPLHMSPLHTPPLHTPPLQALFLSVFACVVGCAACAWGVFPELNTMIHLEAFPDDAFRFKVMGLVGMSLAGTFIWDRICCALFAPRIFKVGRHRRHV